MIKNLNYILILITIVVLGAIGLVFIYGTSFSWMQSLNMPEWRETGLYQDYLADMNLALAPMAVALVVVLGLCIPKRLFSGTALLMMMGSMLFAGAVLGAILGVQLGLSFLLAVAILLQTVVIALTLFGSRRLVFENQSFYVQIGSAFLHMGLVIFVFNLILLADSVNHIPVFWVAATFISLGMIAVFYSEELSAWAGRRRGLEAYPSIPDDSESS